MEKEILLISREDKDKELLEKILDNDQYSITPVPFDGMIDEVLAKNNFPLILADFELIKNRLSIFTDLLQTRSKACLIFFGNDINSEELSNILQKGVYSYIPRRLLSYRLKETILGGLENRRSFIEILEMMDDLKELNIRLEIEKDALKRRNRELSFINRLSSEISYDFNWDTILQRMINAGLRETLEYRLFGTLFNMGTDWKLSLHMVEPETITERDTLISDILYRIESDFNKQISGRDLEYIFIKMKNSGIPAQRNIDIIPLNLAGDPLGFILYEEGATRKNSDNNDVLINTLANMLAPSLKNAQEYFNLRKASVTDSLTGVYNRKGLYDFLDKELPRAGRYKKPVSFVMTDMNNFKSINDTMGHQAGDYVLREMAVIFKKSFRQPDIISRFGGDEFSILLPETELSDAHSIMLRVIDNLNNHTFEWGSEKFKLKMSYGISNSDELTEANNPEELIRLADSRLYIDKAS